MSSSDAAHAAKALVLSSEILLEMDGNLAPEADAPFGVGRDGFMPPLLSSHPYKDRHHEEGPCRCATKVAFSVLESLTLCSCCHASRSGPRNTRQSLWHIRNRASQPSTLTLYLRTHGLGRSQRNNSGALVP